MEILLALAEEKRCKELLQLPFIIENPNCDWRCTLFKRIDEYIEQLANPYLEGRGLQHNIQCLSRLRVGIHSVLEGLGEYTVLKNALDGIAFMEKVNIKKIDASMNLYRARVNLETLEKEQFYHQPIKEGEMIEANGRFDLKDRTGWYLGESIEVCRIEVGNRPAHIMQINLKSSKTIDVVDITAENLFDIDKIDNEVVLFPIILACYCVSPSADNKEQYLISQYLSRYIFEHRKDMKVQGIQYFTVRNEELNPQESTYKNITLYPEKIEKNGYDMTLMNKFEFANSSILVN